MLPELSNKAIEHFITEGYVRIDNAFPADVAREAINILWQDIPFNRHDPHTWTEPVVWLGMYHQPPFVESINTPQLHAAFNQLVGKDKWLPCKSVGAFPVRFPAARIPVDTGKHVDAGFPGADPANFFEWRVNIKSRGRALLMLVLYSDVSEKDAPTLIYPQSHLDVARLLHAEGDAGLSFMEIADKLTALPPRPEALAVGKAGTVYLCHPFLVHAAQAHTGTNPRFMAQPPLLIKGELNITDTNAGFAPVEQAIRLAINI